MREMETSSFVSGLKLGFFDLLQAEWRKWGGNIFHKRVM